MKYEIKSRGNGFQWAVTDEVLRSDIDCSDHEDWIYEHIKTPAGGVFVDVGGFVGSHAIRVAKECYCRVIAFEPVAAHVELFLINRTLNGASDVRLFEMAVGSHCGTINFCADGPADSRVPLNNDKPNTQVRMTTLDHELSHLDRLDVLLIDVEGHECHVLAGAVRVVSRLRPKIIIEVHSHYDGCEHNGNLINEWCDEMGYQSRRIFENSAKYYYVELIPKQAS
jgi:FkbM family methyltransferase